MSTTSLHLRLKTNGARSGLQRFVSTSSPKSMRERDFIEKKHALDRQAMLTLQQPRLPLLKRLAPKLRLILHLHPVSRHDHRQHSSEY